MSIVQISNGAISNTLPINQPIDNTWRYVYDPFPEIDIRYQTCLGYTYTYDANTDVVVATPQIQYLDINTIKQLKINELADYRWNQQNAGTVFNDIPILTDDDSQSKILGIRLQTVIDPTYTVNFKTAIGFFTLDANTIAAVSDAVRLHIQNCFNNEATHLTNINALTDANSVINYDISTGWPI